MKRALRICAVLWFSCLTPEPPRLAAQIPSQTSSIASYQSTINRYCITCHNDKLQTAGLSLEKPGLQDVASSAETWERVIRKLRTASMPPSGVPRPPTDFYSAFAAYLEERIDQAAQVRPNPGRAPIRRLNRAEYANAVRDLLGMRAPVEDLLPADETHSGFDNNAAVLTVSPMLMERYLLAAGRISRIAVGDPGVRPTDEIYTISKLMVQDDRAGMDLPFGSRGGLAVRHTFPLDGQYKMKIRLQRNFRGYIRGLGEAHRLDVALENKRLHSFTIGGERRGRSAPIFSSAAMGDTAQEDYEHTADDVLEFTFSAPAGPQLVTVAFAHGAVETEGPLWPEMTPVEHVQYKGGDPGVDSVVIGGPYQPQGLSETPSRKKIFICHPPAGATPAEMEDCARKIIAPLVRLAYRRPVTAEEVSTVMEFFRLGQKDSFAQPLEAGITAAIERILSGPEFLFRLEYDPPQAPPGSAYRINDLELASRLSFFLWSSIPDDELLGLAERGQLHEKPVLEQQVRRMMADARSQALIENFSGQWLSLRALNSVVPDPIVYPEFDENLRLAFQQETQLFFGSVVEEDRSIVDLLNGDYTFVNQRLARHYGISNVYGSHFRRVKLSDDTRWGLLGKGSVLMATSYPNRTSPVTRGKWVLENILGTPPPPPPPDVPSLADINRGGRLLSMRERMEEHRKNPACASCHKLMDPLGFALENFDGLGKWRTQDGDTVIDPTGALPDGTQFQGAPGMRKALGRLQEQFVATFTERLLTYALGRGVEYYDAPAMRRILRDAASANFRWSAVVLGIVNSKPFQMRRAPQP